MFNLPTIKIAVIHVAIVVSLFISSANLAFGQTEIRLAQREVRCFEKAVKLKHIAEVSSTNPRIAAKIKELDIDQIEEDQNTIKVSKEQVRIRLVLSGIKDSQFQLSGHDSLTVVAARPTSKRKSVTKALTTQIAEQFHMPHSNIQVTIDSKFQMLDSSGFDFDSIQVQQEFGNELPLGKRKVETTVRDLNGELQALRIPVTVAVFRDLVVAKKNISKGQTLTPRDVVSVRRPVMRRNVKLASYEQVLGMQAQTDIQQHELIKSNLVRQNKPASSFVIKRNSYVNIVARRGSLSVVLKDAKALENGKIGEKITLVNPKTKERVVGKVLDSSTVEIRF